MTAVVAIAALLVAVWCYLEETQPLTPCASDTDTLTDI